MERQRMQGTAIRAGLAFVLGIIAALVGQFAIANAPALAAPAPHPLGIYHKYFSKNRQFYLEIIPGKRTGERPEDYCKGTLFKRTPAGEFTQVWSKNLSNIDAPEEVLVSNDGDYVVTLDNWGFSGQGDNVIAIYDRDGKLIKKYSLAELAPQPVIAAMTHHETSIWWRKEDESYIDEKHKWLVTRLWQRYKKVPYKRIKIDLQSGNIVPPR